MVGAVYARSMGSARLVCRGGLHVGMRYSNQLGGAKWARHSSHEKRAP